MENEKKVWVKPELIEINQCRIEENVLAPCNEATDDTCGPTAWGGSGS